jgi:hypothetical protein
MNDKHLLNTKRYLSSVVFKNMRKNDAQSKPRKFIIHKDLLFKKIMPGACEHDILFLIVKKRTTCASCKGYIF